MIRLSAGIAEYSMRRSAGRLRRREAEMNERRSIFIVAGFEW